MVVRYWGAVRMLVRCRSSVGYRDFRFCYMKLYGPSLTLEPGVPAVNETVAVVRLRRRRLRDAADDAAHHGLHAGRRSRSCSLQHLQRLCLVV